MVVYRIPLPTQSEVIYPDNDGQPVANSTIQFRWIVEIKQNLDWLFADDPNVFVAGDLFWYPVEGRIDTPQPKGMRILDSTSPLKLDPLRYLTQRWFSPQALTLGMPYPSCIAAKFVCQSKIYLSL